MYNPPAKRIIDCVRCGQSLRIPVSQKPLRITCPKCGFQWETHTETKSRPDPLSDEVEEIAANWKEARKGNLSAQIKLVLSIIGAVSLLLAVIGLIMKLNGVAKWLGIAITAPMWIQFVHFIRGAYAGTGLEDTYSRASPKRRKQMRGAIRFLNGGLDWLCDGIADVIIGSGKTPKS